MTKYLSIIALLFFAISCGCKEECFTPPAEFSIEIQDDETGKNLIESGDIDTTLITLKATDNGQTVDFSIVGDKVVSAEIGFLSANTATEFELVLGDVGTVYFTTEFDAVSENCCTFFELKSVTFNTGYEVVDDFSYVVKL